MDHNIWNSLTFPWKFPDIVTIFHDHDDVSILTKLKLNKVHKNVILIVPA